MADDGGEYGRGAELLTARERARLRPGVDAAALERLLRRVVAEAPPPRRVPGAATRRAVLAQFFAHVTVDDVRATLREADASEARKAEVERWLPAAAAELRAHWRRRRDQAVLTAWHGQLTDPLEWMAAEVLRVDVPPDAPPDVRALWDAVEPDGEAAFRRVLASAPLGPGIGARLEPGGPRPRRWCDECGAREATMARVRGDGAEPAALIPMTDAVAIYDEDDIPPDVRRAFRNLQRDAAARRRNEGPGSEEPGSEGPDWAAAPIVEYLCEDCARGRRDGDACRS